jgi:hypothetical protein
MRAGPVGALGGRSLRLLTAAILAGVVVATLAPAAGTTGSR